MNNLPKVLAMAFLAIACTTIDSHAAPRKCGRSFNGIQVTNPIPLLMVDGKVQGPVEAGTPPLRMSDGSEIPVKDILSIDIVCLEFDENGTTAARTVLSYITRHGAASLMESHLTALAEAQEEHRGYYGSYAETLQLLGFFASRPPLPIGMVVTGAGWTASARVAGVTTVCHVGVAPDESQPSTPAFSAVTCSEARSQQDRRYRGDCAPAGTYLLAPSDALGLRSIPLVRHRPGRRLLGPVVGFRRVRR